MDNEELSKFWNSSTSKVQIRTRLVLYYYNLVVFVTVVVIVVVMTDAVIIIIMAVLQFSSSWICVFSNQALAKFHRSRILKNVHKQCQFNIFG